LEEEGTDEDGEVAGEVEGDSLKTLDGGLPGERGGRGGHGSGGEGAREALGSREAKKEGGRGLLDKAGPMKEIAEARSGDGVKWRRALMHMPFSKGTVYYSCTVQISARLVSSACPQGLTPGGTGADYIDGGSATFNFRATSIGEEYLAPLLN